MRYMVCELCARDVCQIVCEMLAKYEHCTMHITMTVAAAETLYFTVPHWCNCVNKYNTNQNGETARKSTVIKSRTTKAKLY